MKATYVTVCFIILALHSRTSSAQTMAGSCDLPVVVTGFDNQLIHDLTPTDFSIRLGDVAKTVESVSIDPGAKRIALILDASRDIPQDEWKLETEMAALFARHARPDDRFIFLVTDVEDGAVSWISSNDLANRLEGLTRSRPAPKDSGEKIYDAILTAVNRLDPPQFGDAIFLFGHHEDSGSAATYEHVADQVLKNRLRFFGMSFADRLAQLPPGYDLNKPLPKNLGLTDLEHLSAATGYFFSFHNTRSLNYPGQMPLYRNFLSDLYAWIASPYRLRIALPPDRQSAKLEITLTNLATRKIHQSGIHYPQSLYPCAAR